MKHQLQTIRHNLEPLANNSGARKALTALSELERMVGQQDPVALLVRKQEWHKDMWDCAPPGNPDYGHMWASERMFVYAAPVAQQPQAEAACNPHPKAPHGFNRNASHNAGRYVCDCEGWDAWDAGYSEGRQVGFDADAGQQAEAVPSDVVRDAPPGYVLVPVEPTTEMLYAMHTESLTFYEDEQREAYRAMLAAAAAAAQGEKP